MISSTDLTFITNEPNQTLLDRFKVLIRDTRYFDVLVGYFFSSGFHQMYQSLESTEKIRILIGISTDRTIVDSINKSNQLELEYSGAETKDLFSQQIIQEMDTVEDNQSVEKGIFKFIEWLRSGKMEIRAYPSSRIHSKLYVMTFPEDDRDIGRVITGSSNFTQAGLIDNLELNVELKNPSDYKFALDKFNQLWDKSVDVSDKYIATIEKNTWVDNTITPYELYLKFLYEYFKDELKQQEEIELMFLPEHFKKLEYQEQAVINAKRILEEYGGVFISDVVGLGKTYMSAMLASQLRDGRTLVIASPVLLEEDNPGSWKNVFREFNVPATFESLGKLDSLIKRGTSGYKNVFIDEAHHFRTEDNMTYEKLAQICRGKRVILVTATPYNNDLKDILSQIKLFQNSKQSTIPNIPNLDAFFSSLTRRLKGLDRQNDYEAYIGTIKSNAMEVREKVLKHIMVRRTRKEIEDFFGKDLKAQGLAFPDVTDPVPVFYEFNQEEDEIFTSTINLITQDFKYARYTPLLPNYYHGKDVSVGEQAQKNVGKFMKILLVKRLESSFYAFKNSIERFITSYTEFIKELENGHVYISEKYQNKIFEYIESDDLGKIQDLIEGEKAKKLDAKDFDPTFLNDLQDDLAVLQQIYGLWMGIKRDPKLLKFVEVLQKDPILNSNKLIIFTESKETAQYLRKNLEDSLKEKVLLYHGRSESSARENVITNFDAKVKNPSDEYRILIATEVLSEGVNLHRSCVVINYDIPWNPTRLMQRIGRINRVDTKFKKVYSYNFFPSLQGNNQIKLKEAAEAKVEAFITMLGSDAKLLTENESVAQHGLFKTLTSKEALVGVEEEESPLKYLSVIKEVRDQDPDLFDRIKKLPRKARTVSSSDTKGLFTYFRKGKLQKFYFASEKTSEEKTFMDTANQIECQPDKKRQTMPDDLYERLELNKHAFEASTIENMIESDSKANRESSTQLLRLLKACKDTRQLTEEQEEYFETVKKRLSTGALPKQTIKKALAAAHEAVKDSVSLLKVLAALQTTIPSELLQEHIAESAASTHGPREVILSEYFV